MRISTAQLHQQAVASLLDNQAKLARTQLELSSGQRLLTPADDPSAAVQLAALEALDGRLAQYARNGSFARARLEREETVLAQAVEHLQRVRELAVQGLNDPTGPEGRKQIALEMRERLADLLALANSRDANGDYLFAGFYRGSGEPFADAGSGTFTYAGDEGRRSIAIGPEREVADGDPGTEVFLRIPTTSGVKSVFRIVYDLAVALEANSPSPASLGELDAALDRLGEIRTRVGTRLQAIEEEASAQQDLRLSLAQTMSELRDLDYAEAVARLNRELAGLQAAQQVYLRVQQLSLFDRL